ncbi:unnamed protein product [Sphagnum balticum]
MCSHHIHMRLSSSTFGLPCTPTWPSHYKSKLHTLPIPTAEHTRLFFLHCFPCISDPFFLHTSTTGSIAFCLAASRLTNFVESAALSQPASTNTMAGSFSAHVKSFTHQYFVGI